MEFFATNGKRPVRLSEATRRFAYESLHHKYGLQTKEVMGVSLDDIEGFGTLSQQEQYDRAIERIAEVFGVEVSTITRNKKRLCLAIYNSIQ